MAWKLCSASANAKHIFSEGDLIRLRSGTHISSELTLVRLDNKKLQWREEGGRSPLVGWSKDAMTRGCMSEMGAFYGRTVDLWVDSAFDKKADTVESKMLVHKDHCVLNDGKRFHLEPHDSSKDRCVYDVVVSVHGQGGARPQGIMQIHVIRNGATYRTQTLPITAQGYVFSAINVVDFSKHFCYLTNGGEKLCPNGAKAIPERCEEHYVAVTEHDEQGQYIIWAPDSNLPPRNINKGQKQAKAIAAAMSERYGKTFYWARLMGKVEQEVKVVKTTSTKISTL